MPTLLLAPGTELRNTIEIKRSQFITLIRRTDSQETARAFINEVRAEFPDARHHCSAYIITMPGAQPLQHSSDDGEPAGTAGKPILDVLSGFELTNAAAVVVRYFGGTLLGTGGLVRAYSSSVRECLLGTQTFTPLELTRIYVTARHDIAGRLEAELRGRGYDLLNVSYETTKVVFQLAINDKNAFSAALAQITSGQCSAIEDGLVIREIPAQKLA
ncbi:YigZ family protein [Arcanobacterium hippocoleae]